ncbi:response regulator, partial [Staphylococcus aureus]|uniref:response regulator n=1 Tax=Staphylococcus aureus TaxID=1280 RepID=UPI001E444788
NPVQLALVDYELGGMTGVDLIRLTRREHQSRNRRTPIIMVSGHASPQVILGARDAGVNEFLRKPVTPAALAQKVALA